VGIRRRLLTKRGGEEKRKAKSIEMMETHNRTVQRSIQDIGTRVANGKRGSRPPLKGGGYKGNATVKDSANLRRTPPFTARVPGRV